MARQREALVALGRLAAGLAHEINNSASAATRAVDALQETCEALLSVVGRLADQSISATQFVELDTLRREIPRPAAILDPLGVADREGALSDWLAEHDVERDWIIAPPLAAAGLDVDWCERAASVLDGPALGAGLEWVASSLSTATLLSELKESTRRISDLISAVKSYAQLDRASLQRIAVKDGLESTLVMLAHKLENVTVVRDYGTDVPPIDAIAAELNQVWTNVIDNAFDAMKGTGTLRVSIRAAGNGVVVDRRHRSGDAPGGNSPRVRPVLHHQRCRNGHGSGAGHLAADHRRAARRRDHHRVRAGRDGAPRPSSVNPAGQPLSTAAGFGRWPHRGVLTAAVRNYQDLVGVMTNHPKDRHVLAAAVRGGAELIVTTNLRDFPAEALNWYDVAAVHPDDFLLDQLDLDAVRVLRCLNEQRVVYRKPAYNVGDFYRSLVGLAPKFIAQVVALDAAARP